MMATSDMLDFGSPIAHSSPSIVDNTATHPLPQMHVSQGYIGIDVGGTKIEGVVLDDHSSVLESMRSTSPQGELAVNTELVAMIEDLIQRCTNRGISLAGIGIGIPGRINPHTGDVSHAVNLSISGMHLQADLESKFPGIPISVENDVNAAALGAWTVLDGNRASQLAFINFGTGLACGIVQSGSVHRGVSGAAGEIGHLAIEEHNLLCKCGQRGCLETVASGSAVARLWPVERGHPMQDLILHQEAGDEQACQTLDMVVHAMTKAILTVALSVDPDRIVLGGGLMKTGESLFNRIVIDLESRAETSPFITSLGLSKRLSLSPKDQAIGAIGAAVISVNRA